MKVSITAIQSRTIKGESTESRLTLAAVNTGTLPGHVTLQKVLTDRFRKVCQRMDTHRRAFKARHHKPMRLPILWTKPLTLEVRVDDELILDTATILTQGQLDWSLRCSNGSELGEYLDLAIDMMTITGDEL